MASLCTWFELYIDVVQTPFEVCAEVPGSLSCHWKNEPTGPKEPEGT